MADSRHEFEPGRQEMPIQGESDRQSLPTHHLETHRIGQAEAVIGVRTQPPVYRLPFQIRIDMKHAVYRIFSYNIHEP